MGEDDEAKADKLATGIIPKTWALAYEAKVRPTASGNIMKQERLECVASVDQKKNAGKQEKTEDPPVKDSVAVYAGVLSRSMGTNAEACTVWVTRED